MWNMGVMESILEKLIGDVHFYIYLRKSLVAEVLIERKKIVIEIKNPILALETIVQQVLERKIESQTLQRLKEAGYSVKIKYKALQFNV